MSKIKVGWEVHRLNSWARAGREGRREEREGGVVRRRLRRRLACIHIKGSRKEQQVANLFLTLPEYGARYCTVPSVTAPQPFIQRGGLGLLMKYFLFRSKLQSAILYLHLPITDYRMLDKSWAHSFLKLQEGTGTVSEFSILCRTGTINMYRTPNNIFKVSLSREILSSYRNDWKILAQITRYWP